uniref:Uncharacterized protein n=1 Tax=Latimeria chalumnae TaxID=7897 RepID=H3B4W7_LATCH
LIFVLVILSIGLVASSWILLLGAIPAFCAPLPESSGEYDFELGRPGFKEFVTNSLVLAEKIHPEIKNLQDLICKQHHICNEDELTLKKEYLRIPHPRLEECRSNNLQLDTCMNKMEAGLQVYGDYLNLIKKVIVGSSLAETVQADIMDLQQHIRQKVIDVAILVLHVGMHPQYTLPNFAASFDEQAGGHIVLSHFKRFMETVLRVLQYMK